MYPQYNPYTGETNFGMGAYAGPNRPMIHMSGLGASTKCNISEFIDENILWIAGFAGIVFLIHVSNKGVNKFLG